MAQPKLTQLDLFQINNAFRDLYDTISQLNSRLAQSVQPIAGPSVAAGGIIQGEHKTRILQYNPSACKGCLFYETDRTVWYISDGFAWRYTSGSMTCALTAIPTDLDIYDVGFKLHTTTYNHRHYWDGSAWKFDDDSSGYIGLWVISPGTGWKLCNGSGTFIYEKADCTTSTATVPDATVGEYLKMGASYGSSVQSIVNPSVSGLSASSSSAGTPTGNLSSDSAGTPGGSIGTPNSVANYTAGAVVNLATGGHVHNFFGTPMSNHSHSFTGDAMSGHTHTISGGSVDITSMELKRWQLIPYFRQ